MTEGRAEKNLSCGVSTAIMLVKEDRVGGVCDIPPITHFDASWGPEPRGWSVQKVE